MRNQRDWFALEHDAKRHQEIVIERLKHDWRQTCLSIEKRTASAR